MSGTKPLRARQVAALPGIAALAVVLATGCWSDEAPAEVESPRQAAVSATPTVAPEQVAGDWALETRPIGLVEVGARSSELRLLILDDDEVDAALALAEQYGTDVPEGSFIRVHAIDERLPERIRTVTEYAVITPRGAVALQRTAVGVVLGETSLFFVVRLDGTPAFAGETGLAVPADLLAGEPTLRKPAAPAGVDEATTQKLRGELAKRLGAKGGEARVALVDFQVAGATGGLLAVGHMEASGSFPGGALIVPVSAKGEAGAPAAGPMIGSGIEPLFATDLDSDGADELIYRATGDGDPYTMLLAWDGQAYRSLELAPLSRPE